MTTHTHIDNEFAHETLFHAECAVIELIDLGCDDEEFAHEVLDLMQKFAETPIDAVAYDAASTAFLFLELQDDVDADVLDDLDTIQAMWESDDYEIAA